MEYIITEYVERWQDWCLFLVLGKCSLEESEECLKKEQEKYKDKKLRIEQVEQDDCWWRWNID